MLARRFPLHLYSNVTRAKYGIQIESLPYCISLQQIYLDFLRYILQHTKTFIEGHISHGNQIWSQLKPKIEVLIAYPREWGFREQEFLRNAVVDTGFVDGAGQILLVAESEATICSLCQQASIVSLFQPTKYIVICNAGHSATKITVLSILATQPALKFKEYYSTYLQGGGTLVDTSAETYLRGALENAGLDDEDISEYTSRGVRYFSDHVKKSFHDPTAHYTIEIADSRFNNTFIKTRRGRMELLGATVRSFYDSYVAKMSATLDGLLQTSSISDIILTGEFEAIPFLRKTLQERYRLEGYRVSLLGDSSSAYSMIADGAVLRGVTNHRMSHTTRYSYGFIVSTRFDPQMEEHRGRETYTSSEGYEKIVGAWSQIIDKGVTIDWDKFTRVPFNRILTSPCLDLVPFKTDLFSYSGAGKPNFARDRQGKLLNEFQNVLTLTADLSGLCGALQQVGAPGRTHWSLTYDLCLYFGDTEVLACIEWQEKGVTCTGPVEIRPAEVL
ncbi:hypothetical protein BDV93DRAFT_526924 [Ceratobasidium sp. AG-I]|nr:hypothetical protein BDV93DRAFT_526924 [Ceratobasidium sp. AG-I]